MAFKLRSQKGPGDIIVGASASSESKSVGLDANYSKGPLSLNAATNVGMFGKSISGGISYDTNKLSASLSANKYTGQKAGVNARVSYKF